MAESLKRMLASWRFDREAFVWMDFNDRATGDALIFVVVTRFAILLGLGWSFLGGVTSLGGLEILFFSLLNAVIFWLAFSGLSWAIAKFFFQGSGNFATTLRVVGYAYPTLLVILFTRLVFGNAFLAIITGALWFLAITAHGVRYESGLNLQLSAASVGLAFVAWVIIAQILGRGLI